MDLSYRKYILEDDSIPLMHLKVDLKQELNAFGLLLSRNLHLHFLKSTYGSYHEQPQSELVSLNGVSYKTTQSTEHFSLPLLNVFKSRYFSTITFAKLHLVLLLKLSYTRFPKN